MKRRSYGNKTARVALAVFCSLILTGCGLSGEKAEEPEKEQQSQIENTEAEAEGDKAENIIDIIENEESGEETAEADLTEEDSTEDEEQQDDADGGTVSRPEPKTRPEGFALELDSEDWGLGFGEPGTQPVGNASTEDLAWYHAYYMGDGSEKVLYLTFDCGYENGYTSKILDTLKEKDVPAAFFCTLPQVKDYPELIARMISEGHIVGNHSVKHPSFPTLTRIRMAEELQGMDNYLRTNFGYSEPFFRFPMGEYSDCALDLIGSLGYRSVFWSVAYADWDLDKQKGADYAFNTVTARLHPGAVILLHSVSPDNAEALGRIIDWARGEGYTFKSLRDFPNGQ